MEYGGFRASERRRRRRCVLIGAAAAAAVLILLAVIVTVVLFTGGLLKRNDTAKTTFIERCEAFKKKSHLPTNDCQRFWGLFEQAYVGKDPCQVPLAAYDPLIAAAPFTPACNRMMFWSKTKDVVHDFTEKRDCYITLEDTLLGSVLDGLTWCGKKGSSETFTTDCPGWSECENNSVRSFWTRASAAFADVACGNVTAMLNGSIAAPFSPVSIFGSVELKRFNPDRVKILDVVLVTQDNAVTNCTNASLKSLRKELDKGIQYSCTEVTEAQLQECSSHPEKPCGTCW